MQEWQSVVFKVFTLFGRSNNGTVAVVYVSIVVLVHAKYDFLNVCVSLKYIKYSFYMII